MTTVPFRPAARVSARALTLGLLLALPFGCDDDGTSPPDPDVDELPDSLPAGTYEVGDLHVPAGQTVRVDGAVTVRSSGYVVLDGDVELRPGALLVVAAADSVVVRGAIELDTTGTAAAAREGTSASLAPIGSSALDPAGVDFLGSDVFLTSAGKIEGVTVHIASNGGRIQIDGQITAPDRAASAVRDVAGADGGSIHLGDQATIDRFHERGESTAAQAEQLHISGIIRAGGGGGGFSDVEGIADGLGRVARGSNGGTGGIL